MAVLKHPARHYAYFLFSRRTLDVKAAIAAMEDLSLPIPVDAMEVAEFTKQALRVRRAMQFPASFNPTAKNPNQATLEFLARWGITDAWRNNEFLGPATDLLFAPAIRSMLELLILGPMSHIGIANRVADRFQLPSHAMNAGVVRAYKHYFWDFSAMTAGEWRTFLQAHYTSNAVEYLSVMQAPRNKAGAAFVLSVVDKEPRLVSPQERYEIIGAMAFRRFMLHALDDASSSGTYAAFTALNMMKVADGELDKYRGGNVELLQDLERMRIRYDDTRPRSFQELGFVRPLAIVNTTGEEVPKDE